jgi:hypothetical protein
MTTLTSSDEAGKGDHQLGEAILMGEGKQHLRFEVLTEVNDKFVVFSYVTPCTLLGKYQRFGGKCCLHLQRRKIFEDALRM